MNEQARQVRSGLGLGEYVEALRREGQALAAVLDRGEFDRPVPTCPDWTVRDVAQHLGRVHRWAAGHVRDARPVAMTADESEQAWGAMPDDAALVAWYRGGHEQIVTALEQAPADLVCWSFLPAPSPVMFWARRQAHETAIHRADVEAAHGPISVCPASFAVDGIDELLLAFFNRPRSRLRHDGPLTLSVVASDVDASWTVHIGTEGTRAERDPTGSISELGPASARLHGPASLLYCGLWNRVSWDELTLTGHPTVAEVWREWATVRWA
jgi:uncharacterized protein (TIGR03083 family)